MRIFVTLAALVYAAAAQAQDRITIVVPYAPGGVYDLLARLVAPGVSQKLGRQVIVENVAGAGGTTGILRVVRAAPDGSIVALGDGSSLAIAVNHKLNRNPPYNPQTQLEPVMLLAEAQQSLVSHPGLPETLDGFVSYLKANHQKMQFGSTGAGTSSHLTCSLLNQKYGVSPAHVPYRGAAQLMPDLLEKRIDYTCLVESATAEQVRTGVLRKVAVLPEVNWGALYLPKGTGEGVVRRLREAAIEVLNDKTVRAQLEKNGARVPEPSRQTSEYLRDFLAQETVRWGRAIEAAGIVPQ